MADQYARGAVSERSIQISSSFALAAAHFLDDLEQWADECMAAHSEIGSSHDQGSYTLAWEPLLRARPSERYFDFLRALGDGIRRHFVAGNHWHHGYWRYLGLAVRHAGCWADGILERGCVVAGLLPEGPVVDLSRDDSATVSYHGFAGMAGDLAHRIDRAENLLAIRAVDIARTYFRVSRGTLTGNLFHGCGASTAAAVARGHGRENNAGMSTAVLLPLMKAFS